MFYSEDFRKIDTSRDTHIFLCCNQRTAGRCCGSGETEDIFLYFKQSLNLKRHIMKKGRIVKVNKSGCLGKCAIGPNIVIFPDNIWYNYSDKNDIDTIIDVHLIKGKLVQNLLAKPLNIVDVSEVAS